MEEPTLRQIKHGWAAMGDGWAVHGESPEDAVQRFREAEIKHREIESRPEPFNDAREEEEELQPA